MLILVSSSINNYDSLQSATANIHESLDTLPSPPGEPQFSRVRYKQQLAQELAAAKFDPKAILVMTRGKILDYFNYDGMQSDVPSKESAVKSFRAVLCRWHQWWNERDRNCSYNKAVFRAFTHFCFAVDFVVSYAIEHFKFNVLVSHSISQPALQSLVTRSHRHPMKSGGRATRISSN